MRSTNFKPAAFLPWESHFLSVGGHRMHYFDVGAADANASVEKPVVLLLHGNPTWSFYYRNLIAELQHDFRVIAPDFVGMGLSDHPENAHFRGIDRVRHLETLVNRLGLKHFSLVMHDWGGPIGTGFAVRHVEMIDKLVYLNTTLTETDNLPGIIKRAAAPLTGKFLTKYSTSFLKLTVDLGAKKPLPKEVRAGYFYPYQSVARRSAIWDFVEDIPFKSNHPSYSEVLYMAERLPQLRQKPVLIIWGLQDPCFHREMLSQVAGHFPQAEVVEVPHAGHLVLEDAKDLACEKIHTFLQAAASRKDGFESKESISASAGALQVSPSLYASFRQYAQSNPQHDALIVPLFVLGKNHGYRHISYKELAALVNKYERGLSGLGLKPQDKVLMLVPPGLDFLALSFAVMGRGAVPVFVDPGMGFENLLRCISDCSPDAMIGSPKAQIFRLLKRGLFKQLKFCVTASDWFGPASVSLSFLKRYSDSPMEAAEAKAESNALIAFTSGATGTPKGVLFTNSMLGAQTKIFAQIFGANSGKRDLPLLPVFSLFNLAAGICSVIAPVNPSKPLSLEPSIVCQLISELQISYSFGSPALWQKISEYCVQHEIKLDTLEKVFMAGAPVSPTLVKRMHGILTKGEVYTPYGATEALPVTFVSGAELLSLKPVAASQGGFGTPVGKVVPGVELKIIEASDNSLAHISEVKELPTGVIGEVIVKGANISPAYLNRPDANKISKIADDKGFWHRIGDMGYLDDHANLFFCGRKAHVVKCAGQVYYSDPVENVFNQHSKVRRSALIALYGGQEVAVAIEPLPEFWPESENERKNFIEELSQLAKAHSVTEKIEKFFFHPSFPVDPRHNAKIFRDRLGLWASSVKA